MASNGSAGLGLPTVLTIVFVVLKLTGTINWSWLWVLSPMWISITLGLIFWSLALFFMSRARKKNPAYYALRDYGGSFKRR